MICGFLPFDEESKSVLYKKILNTDYSIPKHVSPEARDLIKRILEKDINQRLTISQIKQHPWFSLNKPICVSKGIIASETTFPVSKFKLIILKTFRRNNLQNQCQENGSRRGNHQKNDSGKRPQ
jgi:serine/threonine protein kinase